MRKMSLLAVSLIAVLAVLVVIVALWLRQRGPSYVYRAPENIDDGWEIGSLEEVGINEKILGQAIDLIREKEYQDIHSILVIKDGKLVFEEYFDGYTYDYSGDEFRGTFTEFGMSTLHNLGSVTKAFTSSLVGIAIDHGFIQDIEKGVLTFFPQYSHLNSRDKDKIKLKHLLTMTSGLEWNQMELSLTDEGNDLIQLFIVPDPIAYVLGKSSAFEPGQRWYYSGGDVNVLGEVIKEATNLRMDDFAEEYLFDPLAITDYEWKYINEDVVLASGDLKLRPRDMAKLGYLYLKGGVWKGKRIVSQEWVQESTKQQIKVPIPIMAERWGEGYGYQWWIRKYRRGAATIDSFLRTGWGGQAIIVFPSLDTVVVFTGGNYAGEDYMGPVHNIVSDYVLPAIE